MKKLALCAVLLIGCVSPTVKNTVSENAARLDKFVELMDAGVTTREKEQEFIKANRKAWHALDYNLNNKPLPNDLVGASSNE